MAIYTGFPTGQWEICRIVIGEELQEKRESFGTVVHEELIPGEKLLSSEDEGRRRARELGETYSARPVFR